MLTGRQREIVNLLAQGWTTSRIARELWLSPLTVTSHVKHAMERTGTHTRTMLVLATLDLSQLPG